MWHLAKMAPSDLCIIVFMSSLIEQSYQVKPIRYCRNGSVTCEAKSCDIVSSTLHFLGLVTLEKPAALLGGYLNQPMENSMWQGTI